MNRTHHASPATVDAEYDRDVDEPALPREHAGAAFAVVLEARLSRRELLLGAVAVGLAGCGAATKSAPTGAAAGSQGVASTVIQRRPSRALTAPSTLQFSEVSGGADPKLHVAAGHRADVLLKWGDAILADSPAFHADQLIARDQARQFGANCDFIGFHPLPFANATMLTTDEARHAASQRGLLSVNHEHTSTRFMWDGLSQGDISKRMTRKRVEVELASVGHSIVEIARVNGAWQVMPKSRYNRRLTALSTHFVATGPAAGHPRLRTRADRTGRDIIGTLHNCSGGVTPWGTTLSGEENFFLHFTGDPALTGEGRNYRRYGFGGRCSYPWWGLHVPRFNLAKEPHEPNRFGWVLEIDPYDPAAAPKKRTALGRFCHEAATTVVNKDGRVVVYMGDDRAGEYIYRFVTAERFDPAAPRKNLNLLDTGTLSVARFEADGSLRWLPLVFGQGPLTPKAGFRGQADVLIETRRAADLLGATPMDRPEDVEPNPVTGVVFAMLTNNAGRKKKGVGNPRGPNPFGHVVAMVPPGGRGAQADHTADVFTWSVPMLGGDPRDSSHGAHVHDATSVDGWFTSPDNCAFDRQGRLWMTTDQGSKWVLTGRADGVFACDTEGPGAWLPRRFMRAPIGAEFAGPCFTPDNATFFVSVQHPGVDAVGSTFAKPATRWPDFDAHIPPRAGVVAVQRNDGAAIGAQ